MGTSPWGAHWSASSNYNDGWTLGSPSPRGASPSWSTNHSSGTWVSPRPRSTPPEGFLLAHCTLLSACAPQGAVAIMEPLSGQTTPSRRFGRRWSILGDGRLYMMEEALRCVLSKKPQWYAIASRAEVVYLRR